MSCGERRNVGKPEVLSRPGLHERIARHRLRGWPETGSRRSELQGQWHHTSAKRTSRYRSGAFPRSGFVDTIVISPSDSTNLDAVEALTRGDETVLEAVSVFIDHAGTLIEQGGPMVLLSAPPKGLCRS